MTSSKQPSRLLLILAGALTQLTGTVCLVLALASLPVVHDLHSGMHSLIASIIAALATIVCGTLVYRGRLVPLALATGLDIGFGIVLPRGGSAIGSLLRILPADEAGTAETLVTAGAIAMFVTAVLCIVAVPSALKLRRWARTELDREAAASGGESASRSWSTKPGFGPLGSSVIVPPAGRASTEPGPGQAGPAPGPGFEPSPFGRASPPAAPPFRPSVGGPARPGSFGAPPPGAMPPPGGTPPPGFDPRALPLAAPPGSDPHVPKAGGFDPHAPGGYDPNAPGGYVPPPAYDPRAAPGGFDPHAPLMPGGMPHAGHTEPVGSPGGFDPHAPLMPGGMPHAGYPEPVGSPARTQPGVGPSRLMPTQVLHVGPPRSKALVIGAVAVSVVAIGIVVIAATAGDGAVGAGSGSGSAAGSGAAVNGSAAAGSGKVSAGSAAVLADAGPAIAAAGDGAVGDAGASPDAAPATPPPDELIASLHTALVHAKPAELGALLDATCFAFGVEAHEVTDGRDAVVAMLRHDLGEVPAGGFDVAAKFTHTGHEGEVAWLAEELRVGGKTFVITAVAGLHAGTWTIAALHWAMSMPNDTAYKLARDGDLAVPDAIPDTHDTSPLAQAMRTAFASKPSFVDARSVRPDAFNFGSAPGERAAKGDAIKRTFAKIRATIRLHDAVRAGAIGETGGWGAANIDFTDADRDGTDVTQTFRVLVAWIKEDAGWRIVQTQWSNAR